MELEFDKEIDAILRHGRDDRGVLAGKNPLASKHIDADSIAAFVENALPAKTRTLYMEHFADCDRCRRILSQSMLFASESSGADVKSAHVVSEQLVTPVVPWYQKLFRAPNLALAMGALVMVFGGFFAFTVIQNRSSDHNASVAQITDRERQNDSPFAGQTPAASTSTNAAAAPAATNLDSTSALSTAKAVPKSTSPPAELTPDKPAITLSKPGEVSIGTRPDSDVMTQDEDKIETPRPVAQAAPAPPAILGGALANERETKKETDDKAINKGDSSNADSMIRKQAEAPRGRDLPAAPSKSGTGRTGPLNAQLDGVQNQVFDTQEARSVGGKSFNQRNGAWYDTAYKNQATSNFRRGTAEYKKLDAGLRNIAERLGGTVIVVWKAKAYRIQ